MTTTGILRQINATRALRLLRRAKALSRSDIARDLQLTRTTVGNAVKLLLDEGLVFEPDAAPEGGRPEARVGRPGVGLSLNPQGAYFVGLDIATTTLTAVLIDLTMAPVATFTVAAGPDIRDVATVARRLGALAEQAVAAAGTHRERVRGIGVSIPGLVARDGRIRNAPFLGWQDVDLRALLAPPLGSARPIRVFNDAVAIASAILSGSAGEPGADDFLLVLMSEGIGSAMVRQGRVMDGFNGFAGEIGQMVMAETCASGTATFQLLAGERFFRPFLASGRPVAEAIGALCAAPSSPAFAAALDTWGDRLAAGFVNAIRLLDPERIVLGGSLAALYPLAARRVEAGIARELAGIAPPPIVLSAYGAEGAAIGAAAMIREDVFSLPGYGTSPDAPARPPAG